jgi:hypothetical protein
MNVKIKWTAVVLCLAAWNAYGVFTPPTQDQLKAAAEDPARVTALIQDASVSQAAEVGKDIMVQIVKLNLKPDIRDARIASLVTNLFQAMPKDDWKALAIALAKTVAASPTASMSPAIVSAIQRAIITVAEIEIGTAFGNAYNLAMQTVAGAPGGGKNVPPPPPPPPVALPYEGQRLR